MGYASSSWLPPFSEAECWAGLAAAGDNKVLGRVTPTGSQPSLVRRDMPQSGGSPSRGVSTEVPTSTTRTWIQVRWRSCVLPFSRGPMALRSSGSSSSITRLLRTCKGMRRWGTLPGPTRAPHSPWVSPHLALVATQHVPGAVLLLGLAVHADGVSEGWSLHFGVLRDPWWGGDE